MRLNDLHYLLNEQFAPHLFQDGCHNGLVIPGRDQVDRILLGVSVNRHMITRALEMHVDALLVHHGLFLSGNWSIPGPLYPMIRLLMENEISLFAYHLPMDAHTLFSHNRYLLERLGCVAIEPFVSFGMMADLPNPLSIDSILENLPFQPWTHVFGTSPLTLMNPIVWDKGRWVCRVGPDLIKRVAVVSGRGGEDLPAAASAGADLFITGEISEYHPEVASINKINLIALGHYLSEKGGLLRLATWLKETTKIETFFFEEDNPL